MSLTTVKFDGQTISSSPYVISKVNHDHAPAREVFSNTLARERGGVVVNAEYKSKIIQIQGHISAQNISDLEMAIDNLKSLMSAQYAPLEIDYAGVSRRYYCTVSDISIMREHYNNNHAPYSITLIAPDGVGYDTALQTYFFSNGANEEVHNINIIGSTYPNPILEINVSAVGNSTDLSVACNGDIINTVVGQTLALNDVLTFDCKAKKLFKNATEVDYVVIFPRFKVGQNQLTTNMDSVYDVKLTYNPTYI